MYAIINRNTLQLEEVAREVPSQFRTHEYVAVLVQCYNMQSEFDRYKFSLLELRVFYRNITNAQGYVSPYRSSLCSMIQRVLQEGKPLFGHSAPLFPEDTDVQQAPTAPDRPAANTVAPKKTSSAPRGGNRAIIWEVADRMWNERSNPKEAHVVLALRREIMAVLESENGIKKATSSTALGEWQKVRLNNAE